LRRVRAAHETVPVELPPPTRYARRGELSIAYQAFGSGPRAMVSVPALPSHLDLMWTEPASERGLRRAARLGRVVVFDPLGLGLSDPVDHVPTLEEQADDVRTVMDAAGLEHAMLFASAFSTPGVVLFAAESPERVDGLLLWGPFAQTGATAPEDSLVGWEGKAAAVGAAWQEVLDHWGEGRSLDVFAPGLATERLRRRWATLERASASPAMARAITEAARRADLTEVLPLVEAPTVVVMHSDTKMPQGAARYVAELIPNATFRALPPSGPGMGIADWTELVFDEAERLLTGQPRASASPDRILATVLFTDVVDSTRHAASLGDDQWRLLNDRHLAAVRDSVDAAGGQLVHTSGDGTLSVLPGPARAIRCAQAINHAIEPLGIQVRAGVHTGECERTDDDLAGLAVHIGARVGAAAGPGEVWVSRTVRDLIAGSGIEMTPRGTHRLKGVPEQWELFSVVGADPAPVAVTPERAHLGPSDRIILAAARRAPRLMRALQRG
jgi:class 3 adenylate cyclase